MLIVLARLALAYLIKLSPPAAGTGSAVTTETDIQSLAFGAPTTERSLVIPPATSESSYLERTATAKVGTEEVEKRELPELGYEAASHDAAPAQLDHGKSQKNAAEIRHRELGERTVECAEESVTEVRFGTHRTTPGGAIRNTNIVRGRSDGRFFTWDKCIRRKWPIRKVVQTACRRAGDAHELISRHQISGIC